MEDRKKSTQSLVLESVINLLDIFLSEIFMRHNFTLWYCSISGNLTTDFSKVNKSSLFDE